MNIGFYGFSSPLAGGVYQYMLSLLEALKDYSAKVTVFTSEAQYKTLSDMYPGFSYNVINMKDCFINDKIKRSFIKMFRWNILSEHLLRVLNPDKKIFNKKKLDVMIYPATSVEVLFHNIPSVMPVHDLAHRLHPEFPEIGAASIISGKKFFYKIAIKYAGLILADSFAGKDDILRFYEINGVNKVKVLPFVPPKYLIDLHPADLSKEYSLNFPFIFYPAQFWMHKNHIRLIEALHMLKIKKGFRIPLVLVGAKKNSYKQVKKRSEELGLVDQIYYLGYVGNEVIASLYKKAVALVFPSCLGPTNIPPIEAFLLGCPVLAADSHPGVREQLGDAAVFVNPYSVESIADGIEQIWTNEELRKDLIIKGRKIISLWGQLQFNERFGEIVSSFYEQRNKMAYVNEKV